MPYIGEEVAVLSEAASSSQAVHHIKTGGPLACFTVAVKPI